MILLDKPLRLLQNTSSLHRLESFASATLLIDSTACRRVYLHRPPGLRGIINLCLGTTFVDEVPGVNISSLVPAPPLRFRFPTWFRRKKSVKFEMKAEWEYIRRYMDEGGLDLVDPPRLSSHLRLPWPAFAAQFEALGPYRRHSGPLTWLGMLLISPALVVIGLGHWVSLLLCFGVRVGQRSFGKPDCPASRRCR